MKKFLLVLLFIFTLSVIANAEWYFVTNTSFLTYGISSGGGGTFLLGTSNTRVSLAYRVEDSEKLIAEQQVLSELKKQLNEQLAFYNSKKDLSGSNQFRIVIDIMEFPRYVGNFPMVYTTLSNVQKYGLEILTNQRKQYEEMWAREILYYIKFRTQDIVKLFYEYSKSYRAVIKITNDYVRETQVPNPVKDKTKPKDSSGVKIKLDLTFDVIFNPNGELYYKEPDYILW